MEKLHAETETISIHIAHWPSPQDYNEAVQTPRITFSDPDLKNGEAELNEIGLPRPRSGNFATVYKFSTPTGKWALRCFLKSNPRQEGRYQAIESALTKLNSECTVKFDYIADGMAVWGNSYPVLKMEWAEGLTLEQYVRLHLSDSEKLKTLALELRDLNLTFKQHGIAHGDLQHGNILVLNSGIKLVDYDGMFVPELSGEDSPELGHRNYQHPKRRSSDYNASLDNFSAWLIYVSLICLSEDSSLWQALAAGDDKLIFAEKDLKNPLKSRRFYSLEHHKNETIRSHSRFLRSLLDLEIIGIPFLDADLVEQTILPDLDYQAIFPSGTMDKSTLLHDQSLSYESAGNKLAPPPAPAPSTIKRKFPFHLYVVFGLAIGFAIISYVLPNHLAPSQSNSQFTASSTTKVAEGLSRADLLSQQAHQAYYRDDATRFAIGLYKEAIDEYQKQKTGASSADFSTDRKLAGCWHQLGLCYERISERELASEAYDKALEIYTEVGDKDGLQGVRSHKKTLHYIN